MLRRIFIAIALSDHGKDELARARARYAELPARWTSRENLHITFAFLGNMSDGDVEKLRAALREVLKETRPFSLLLSRLLYGPGPKDPRMIWAVGEASSDISRLKERFAKSWPRWEDERSLTIHATLARLVLSQFKRLEQEERPIVNDDIHVEIPVRSLEIMESVLSPRGAKYFVIESIPLSNI